MLGKLKQRDEQLKAQIEDHQRADGVVELYRKVWEYLRDKPDAADLREEIRVFVRDLYGIFFKDPKKGAPEQ